MAQPHTNLETLMKKIAALLATACLGVPVLLLVWLATRTAPPRAAPDGTSNPGGQHL